MMHALQPQASGRTVESLDVIRVLMVEDNPTDAMVACDEMAHALYVTFAVEQVDRLQRALNCLANKSYDIVLLDLGLPDSDGLATFTRLRAAAPDVPVVVLSHRDEQLAIQAVKAGAQDYLVKGQVDGLLVRSIRHALERAQAQRAVRSGQTDLARSQAIAHLGNWNWDIDNDVVCWSDETYRIYGVDAENFDGMMSSVLSFVHPQDRAAERDAIDGVLRGDNISSWESRIVQPNGQERTVMMQAASVERDGANRATRVSGVILDITDRKQAQVALRASEAQLAGVIDSAMDAIVSVDGNHRIVLFNTAAEAMFGHCAADVVGHNVHHLVRLRAEEWPAQQAGGFVTPYVPVRTIGKLGQLDAVRSNGEIFPVEASLSRVTVEGQDVVTVILRDITDRKAAEHALEATNRELARSNAQLERIAHYDTLTGLPNRALLTDRLQQAIANCQRRGSFAAIAFLDLDSFTAVNETHGRDAGDALLITLSQRMKAVLRDCDSMARIGGDEFAFLLVDMEHAEDCEPALGRLLLAASTPVQLGDTTLQISASIGVTIYPRDGGDADRLMRHADHAMYLAKQSGRNRYQLFDVAQNIALKAQRDSLRSITQALENREFVLFYQPKVNMRTGEVIGAEALIRWQHPERGLLAPAAFLPAIEDHPISIDIGEWVVNTALAQLSQWRAAGLNLVVSVNIAARQLQHADFVPFMRRQLQAFPDVPPRCLELEILETSALQDIKQVSEVMKACQTLGVRFALDDFGTGYSSLTYLRRLPAEMIKIDQSFVRDMLTDPEDLAIVRGVIGLAAAFRREVIAEGVETVAHGELLLPLGCELAQGYGIARPMPPCGLPGWIATWRPDPAWCKYGSLGQSSQPQIDAEAWYAL